MNRYVSAEEKEEEEAEEEEEKEKGCGREYPRDNLWWRLWMTTAPSFPQKGLGELCGLPVPGWSSARMGFAGKPFPWVPELHCESSEASSSCDHVKLLHCCDQSI